MNRPRTPQDCTTRVAVDSVSTAIPIMDGSAFALDDLFLVPSSGEVIWVSAVADVLTVQRDISGTGAAPIPAGCVLRHMGNAERVVRS